MVKSIRWRLQLWYAAVLTGVVGGFAVFLYYEVQSARFHEVDADLLAAANYLDTTMRPFPLFMLSGDPAPPGFKEKGRGTPGGKKEGDNLAGRFKEKEKDRDQPGGKGDWKPGPPQPSRERLLEDLSPPGWRSDDATRFYGVCRADWTPLKAVNLSLTRVPWTSPKAGTESLLYSNGAYRQCTKIGPRNTHIIVGRSTERLTGELRFFAWQLAIAGSTVMVVGLVGGWMISSRIVRPIARITATAAQISLANLSERIEAENVESELVELATVLNATFDRLQAAFAQQAQFTADASHELRTPLTIIKSHAELALTRSRDAESYRATITACHTAADRMTGIVDGLLILARADAGQLQLQRQPVQLATIVEETVTLLTPVANDAQVSITTELEAVTITGDAESLARVVSNLVTNAIHYNRADGSVHVRIHSAETAVELSVTDTGWGIPEADRPGIFQRFYRVDKARTRATGGTGLGLAICRSIVEAHGGTIDFESHPNTGTTFRMLLPRA